MIENILSSLNASVAASFFRTAAGAELDLVLTRGRKAVAVEAKASSTPRVSRGFWNAIEDVGADHAWVIAPIKDGYPLGEKATASSIEGFLRDPRVSGFMDL